MLDRGLSTSIFGPSNELIFSTKPELVALPEVCIFEKKFTFCRHEENMVATGNLYTASWHRKTP
jgi:hypothetical protein